MKRLFLPILVLCILTSSCEQDTLLDDGVSALDLQFPEVPMFADNPMTEEGKLLGRMLFYEKSLSSTNEISCASCHKQELAFSDGEALAIGVKDKVGPRHSMTLANVGFFRNGFFWDGRSTRLKDLALLPIQNELEMDETLENVIQKLADQTMYKEQFHKAFGDSLITEHKIGKALEQFLMSLISNNSRYDQASRGEIELTESELSGEVVFISKGCNDCHSGFNIDDIRFLNNGLDSEQDMTDLGRELVTEDEDDRAKFKTPSLRNIGVSAPYMHDGRFSTLDEVISHYSENVERSETVAGEVLGGFGISEERKADLINFLHTLTDESFLTDPQFSDPF